MNKLFDITNHAIEQFIRRWESNKDPERAEEELDALLRTSKVVGKTKLGHAIVVSGHRPEVRMVIKDRKVCVTVLPPGGWGEIVSEYEDECVKLSLVIQEERRKYYLEHQAEYEKRMGVLVQQINEGEEKVVALNEHRKLLGQQKTDLLSHIQDLRKQLREIEKQKPDQE